jgi:hypothetical protein
MVGVLLKIAMVWLFVGGFVWCCLVGFGVCLWVLLLLGNFAMCRQDLYRWMWSVGFMQRGRGGMCLTSVNRKKFRLN